MRSFIQAKKEEGKGIFRIIAYIVIALFIVSIFIIGSLSGMLGKGGASFVTVEGREVMDRRLKDGINAQTKNINNPGFKRQYIQYLTEGYIRPLIYSLESDNQGLTPSLSSLADSGRVKYQAEKAKYEKKNNMAFPYRFVDYLEVEKSQYMQNVFVKNIESGNVVDELSLNREYALRNTTSEVEVVSMNFKDYLAGLEVSDKDLKAAFDKRKNNYLKSVSVKVLEYKTAPQARGFSKTFKSNSKEADKAFASAKTKVYRPGDIKEFYKLKSAGKGQVTDVFQDKKKFVVAKVLNIQYAGLSEISKKDRDALKKSVLNRTRAKHLLDFKKLGKKELEAMGTNFTAKGNVKYVKTKPFSIYADAAVKNAKDDKPINWLAPQNKPFFNAAFQKTGTVSKVISWRESLYRVKVLNFNKPQFPIPVKTREELKKSLAERQKKQYSGSFYRDIRTKYEVLYHWNNLNRLFGLAVKGR